MIKEKEESKITPRFCGWVIGEVTEKGEHRGVIRSASGCEAQAAGKTLEGRRCSQGRRGGEENRDPENEGLSSLGHPGVKHGAQDLLAETRRPELQACLSQQDL